MYGMSGPYIVLMYGLGDDWNQPKARPFSRLKALNPNNIADNQPFDCTTLFLKSYFMYDNELRLFWAKAFPLPVLSMSHIWFFSFFQTMIFLFLSG